MDTNSTLMGSWPVAYYTPTGNTSIHGRTIVIISGETDSHYAARATYTMLESSTNTCNYCSCYKLDYSYNPPAISTAACTGADNVCPTGYYAIKCPNGYAYP